MAERMFGVVLTDEGLAALQPLLNDYLTEGVLGKYLYCREASPDRNYLHVVAERTSPEGASSETEIFIPHRFVKVVFSSSDRKHIGFL